MSPDSRCTADLSPYIAHEVLGEGGTGRVYLAQGPAAAEPVALKVFHPPFISQAGQSELVVKHAGLVQQLGHRGIVSVYDAGRLDDGSVFVAMEHLRGRDLGEALAREEALDFGWVLHMAAEACDALRAAHSIGMVHQDLKPNNIFLACGANETESVKLLDFAPQAASAAAEPRDATGHDGRLGTPEYWSPEQACGGPLDPRSDIYTLGVVMYEALTGMLPFRSHSYTDIIAQHIHTQPAQLTAPAAQRPIPEAVQDLVLRCLRKNPAERFQSMTELLDAVVASRFAAESLVLQPRETVAERRKPPPVRTITHETKQAPRQQTTRRSLVTGAAGGIVAAAAVLTLLFGGTDMLPGWTSPHTAAVARRQNHESAAKTVVPFDITSDPEGAYIYYASGGRLLGKTPTRIDLPLGTRALDLVLRFPNGERARVAVLPDRPGHAHVLLPSSDSAKQGGEK